MPKALSAADIAAYRRDGVCFPIPALSPSEALHYRGCLEAFEHSQGAPLRGSMMF